MTSPKNRRNPRGGLPRFRMAFWRLSVQYAKPRESAMTAKVSRAEVIFFAALKRSDPGDRAALLDRECNVIGPHDAHQLRRLRPVSAHHVPTRCSMETRVCQILVFRQDSTLGLGGRVRASARPQLFAAGSSLCCVHRARLPTDSLSEITSPSGPLRL